VHDGHEGGILEGQRDGSNGLDTGHETVNELGFVNVENVGRKGVALVKDLDNSHTVSERRNVEHVEQSGFRGTDTGTGGDDLDIGDNFNGTTSNLGGDTESLEERGLSGFHTSVASRDRDVLGGKGTGTGRSSNLVCDDDFSDLFQVTRGEDETNVSLDMGKETFELRVLGHDGTKSTADHGVVAHENDTFTSESDTDLVHLVGTDVVDIDQEDGSWENIRMCINVVV